MMYPHGPEGERIDSSLMLKESVPVIGTGEWADYQCDDFKDTKGNGIKIGDIILVREGNRPLALCKIKGGSFKDQVLTNKYLNKNFRNIEVLDWYKGKDKFPKSMGTLEYLRSSDTKSWKFVDKWYKQINANKKMQDLINILKHKKQIILQGPPGTGKTYTAKQIAKQLAKRQSITEADIRAHISVSQVIPSSGNYSTYSVDSFTNNGVYLQTAGDKYEAKFAAIIDAFERRTWENGQVAKGNDPYNAAVAKYIDEQQKQLPNERVKLIQFHPAYSYEDFVRGITAETVNNNVAYDTKNKVLAKLAKKAFENPRENYVLIIDEINRANLPAVLGELIYALEYRGDVVESMYGINGDNNLVLPNNLFIIGTMNTADRSVGHIDYAIRRRFAFKSVLPNKHVVHELSNTLFRKVSELFIDGYDNIDWKEPDLKRSKHIAQDFNPEDVWIGHSYFMTNQTEQKDLEEDKKELQLKLDYEIKPLLREYVKDGILREDIKLEGAANAMDYINNKLCL